MTNIPSIKTRTARTFMGASRDVVEPANPLTVAKSERGEDPARKSSRKIRCRTRKRDIFAMAGCLPLLLGELNPREPHLFEKLRTD